MILGAPDELLDVPGALPPVEIAEVGRHFFFAGLRCGRGEGGTDEEQHGQRQRGREAAALGGESDHELDHPRGKRNWPLRSRPSGRAGELSPARRSSPR